MTDSFTRVGVLVLEFGFDEADRYRVYVQFRDESGGLVFELNFSGLHVLRCVMRSSVLSLGSRVIEII